MTKASDPVGLWASTFDALGRIATANGPGYPNGCPITNVYDPNGNRTVLDFGWGRLTYSFDARDQVYTVQDPGNQAGTATPGRTTFTYEARGLVTRRDGPNKTLATFAFDSLGRQYQLLYSKTTGVEIEHAYYSHDPDGNPLTKDTVNCDYVYTYDELNRLKSESNADGLTTWTYDPAGRRSLATSLTAIATFSYDAADELLTVQSNGALTSYVYDANGSTRSVTPPAGTPTTYTWNGANHLTTIRTPARNNNVAYRFDGLRVKESGAVGEEYLIWDPVGGEIIGRNNISSAGNPKDLYVRSEHGVHRPLDERASATDSGGYQTDALGSMLAQSSFNASALTFYSFDGWGNVLAVSSSGRPLEWIADPSYWHDQESGLYYVRARWYDPVTGLWISRDPIGFRGGDPIVYRYGMSMPTCLTDPSGLKQGKGKYQKCCFAVVYPPDTAPPLRLTIWEHEFFQGHAAGPKERAYAEDTWEQCCIRFNWKDVDRWSEQLTRNIIGSNFVIDLLGDWQPPAYPQVIMKVAQVRQKANDKIAHVYYAKDIASDWGSRVAVTTAYKEWPSLPASNSILRQKRNMLVLPHEIGRQLGLLYDDYISEGPQNLMYNWGSEGNDLTEKQCDDARAWLLRYFK